jgi:hypothetical protein
VDIACGAVMNSRRLYGRGLPSRTNNSRSTTQGSTVSGRSLGTRPRRNRELAGQRRFYQGLDVGREVPADHPLKVFGALLCHLAEGLAPSVAEIEGRLPIAPEELPASVDETLVGNVKEPIKAGNGSGQVRLVGELGQQDIHGSQGIRKSAMRSFQRTPAIETDGGGQIPRLHLVENDLGVHDPHPFQIPGVTGPLELGLEQRYIEPEQVESGQVRPLQPAQKLGGQMPETGRKGHHFVGDAVDPLRLHRDRNAGVDQAFELRVRPVRTKPDQGNLHHAVGETVGAGGFGIKKYQVAIKLQREGTWGLKHMTSCSDGFVAPRPAMMAARAGDEKRGLGPVKDQPVQMPRSAVKPAATIVQEVKHRNSGLRSPPGGHRFLNSAFRHIGCSVSNRSHYRGSVARYVAAGVLGRFEESRPQ